MQSRITFIESLGWHLGRLQALIGEQWPEVKAQLDKLLHELVDEKDEHALQARVNRIYRIFQKTPAESFVRELFQQARGSEKLFESTIRIPSATRAPLPTINDKDGLTQVAAVLPSTFRIPSATLPPLPTVSDKGHLAQVASVLADAVASIPEKQFEKPLPPAQGVDRHINAWISERSAAPAESLVLGERYTLNFCIGKEVTGSLIEGKDAAVPTADFPIGGLQTEWIINTSAFELSTDDLQVVIEASGFAKFSLLIPQQGESEVRRLFIVPRSLENPRLEVMIYAIKSNRKELYRQFSIEVQVKSAAITLVDSIAVKVSDEHIFASGRQMNLRDTHEWTTPPARLRVDVITGNQAYVFGDLQGSLIPGQQVQWSPPLNAGGSIKNARDSAENFRDKWTKTKYLNDIDRLDLLQRIDQCKQTGNWANRKCRADQAHKDNWDKVGRSMDLRDLAIYGHNLYQVFFPPDSQLRKWIDSLPLGSRIDIKWTEDGGAGYIPSVPWGLMYLPDPPNKGELVNPMGFLALRFRISYWSYRGGGDPNPSKALGAMANAHQTYCLYWGDPKDETHQEAIWQRQQFQGWENQTCVPQIPGSPTAREEVVQALSAPQPSPTSVIYFFCQAAVGDGNKPVLQFGPTSKPVDTLGTTDLLSGKTLKDKPLVFANACRTLAADPYFSNLLEQSLFMRGCRGFLGTETKVPIQLASCFATIFFNFFYRKIDDKPMAVGEALFQTRLFLLTEYANIGGIFYTYLNQYELFMANREEIEALRL